MTVNDTNNADHVRIQLVVHGIGIARQEHAPEQATHDEVLFGRTRDMNKGVINGVQKSFGGRRRSFTIPLERSLDLLPCQRANAQREHLAKFSEQSAMNIRPRIAGLGRFIRLELPTLKLAREVAGDRCGARRIETIPQLAHQLDPLLGGECVDWKCLGRHIETMRQELNGRNCGGPVRVPRSRLNENMMP